MNITDVGHLSSDADTGEDKMLKGAKRENKSIMDIAHFYTDAFFSDCAKLNIKRPDVVEPATNCIREYIQLITKLLDTGYAYHAGGNIYFDTSKAPGRIPLESLVLELGLGEPEDEVALIALVPVLPMKHLGEDLDIHCGGIDNAFPHHTNEIAQSEAYLGHK